MTREVIKTPLERARGKAKQAMIAQAYGLLHSLEMTEAAIRGRLEFLKAHEMSEWEVISGIHNDVMSLYVELGLTELVQKYVQFQFAHFAARPDDEIDLEEIGG